MRYLCSLFKTDLSVSFWKHLVIITLFIAQLPTRETNFKFSDDTQKCGVCIKYIAHNKIEAAGLEREEMSKFVHLYATIIIIMWPVLAEAEKNSPIHNVGDSKTGPYEAASSHVKVKLFLILILYSNKMCVCVWACLRVCVCLPSGSTPGYCPERFLTWHPFSPCCLPCISCLPVFFSGCLPKSVGSSAAVSLACLNDSPHSYLSTRVLF